MLHFFIFQVKMSDFLVFLRVEFLFSQKIAGSEKIKPVFDAFNCNYPFICALFSENRVVFKLLHKKILY